MTPVVVRGARLECEQNADSHVHVRSTDHQKHAHTRLVHTHPAGLGDGEGGEGLGVRGVDADHVVEVRLGRAQLCVLGSCVFDMIWLGRGVGLLILRSGPGV